MAKSLRQFKETVEMQSGLLGKVRSSKYFSSAIMLAALVFVACVHIWQRVHVIHQAQNVGILREDNRMLVDATKKVRTDVSALSMTTRIETYASDTLGLKPITGERLVVIKKDVQKSEEKDEFSSMLSSIQRVADYLPEVSEAQAEPTEFRPIKFDSLKSKGQK